MHFSNQQTTHSVSSAAPAGDFSAPRPTTPAFSTAFSPARRRSNLLLNMPIGQRLSLGFLLAALIAALVAGLIGVQRTL
jgi:hypothetical protein